MIRPELDDGVGTRVAGLLISLSILAVGLSLVGGSVVGTATGIQQNDDFEPNDDFDAAATVSAPFSADNLRTNAADDDFYAAELQQGDRVTVSVEFAHAEGDVDLVVFDPNRDQIDTSASFDDGESVSFQARTSGTYYVLILGWAEDGTDYSLTVERASGTLPANDDYEYNDGFSSATAVEAPFDAAELRITGDDRDVFAVEVGAETRLNASVRFVHDEANVDLLVYNSSRELVTVADSYTDNESVSYPIREAETLYIEVVNNDDSNTPYSLSVRTSPVATDDPGNDTPATTNTQSPSSNETTVSETTTAASGTTTGTRGTTIGTPGFTALLGVLGIAGAVAVRRVLHSSTDEGRDQK